MGYICILCFFQFHVTLQPYTPGRACSTQQQAYGSPSEAQLEGCPSQIFFGLCAEFFVPEACWRKAESLKSSHQTSCRCAQWSMPWFHGKYVMSNFKCFWMLEINIFTDSVSVLTLCCWPWSPQYQLLIWASASSITGINYLLTIIDSEAWFFCLADKACRGSRAEGGAKLAQWT